MASLWADRVIAVAPCCSFDRRRVRQQLAPRQRRRIDFRWEARNDIVVDDLDLGRIVKTLAFRRHPVAGFHQSSSGSQKMSKQVSVERDHSVRTIEATEPGSAEPPGLMAFRNAAQRIAAHEASRRGISRIDAGDDSFFGLYFAACPDGTVSRK